MKRHTFDWRASTRPALRRIARPRYVARPGLWAAIVRPRYVARPGLWAAIAIALVVSIAVLSAQQPQPPPIGQKPPVFRGGANLVQVDAYPTRDGKIVEGLTAGDFQVFEDGKPQAVDSVEFIRIEPNTPDALPPRSEHAGRGQSARGRSAQSRVRDLPRLLPHEHHRLVLDAASPGGLPQPDARAERSVRRDDAEASAA